MFEALLKYPFEKYRTAEGLVLLSSIPVEVFLAAFVVVGLAAWALYRRVGSRTKRNRRRWLLAIRMAFVAVLLFMLTIPALKAREPAKKVFTAILVDTSRSMSIDDLEAEDGEGRKVSRIDLARELVLGEDGRSGLVHDEGIREVCEVLLYAFDEDTQAVTERRQFDAEGAETDIWRAFETVDAEPIPLSAMVIVTDGNKTKGRGLKESAALMRPDVGRGVPVFVVGAGKQAVPGDYQIVKVLAPKRVRRNSEVRLDVVAGHAGLADRPFRLNVGRLEPTGDGHVAVKPMLDQPRVVSPRPDSPGGNSYTRTALTFLPDKSGTYEVAILPDENIELPDDRAENNLYPVEIEIRRDRLPVLYVEGSPRPEYRFLRQAMERDEDFRVVGLLRLGTKKQGEHAGEGLYLRQGAGDEEFSFLKDGFPRTSEQLFAFQAVIVGDIEADYFSDAQMQLLRRFVVERGGGLLMLGGVNSFGPGGYARTPVGELLPVRVTPNDAPYSDEEYTAVATPAGLRHPLMRIVGDDPDENRRHWEQAPPLIGITPVAGVKSRIAEVLMVQKDTGAPVLAAQPAGSGRVVAFTSGGSWYWRMNVPSENEFYEKFWKQVIRWTAVGAREQVKLSTDADVYAPGSQATIAATVMGRDFQPVNDAKVVATVTDMEGRTYRVPMPRSLGEDGAYLGRFEIRDSGFHSVEADVTAGGLSFEPVETFFEVTGERTHEFRDAGLKARELRDDLSAPTGGKYYELDGDLDATRAELAKEIIGCATEARKEEKEIKVSEIWDMPLLFALLLGLAGAEWLLRRRSGLA